MFSDYQPPFIGAQIVINQSSITFVHSHLSVVTADVFGGDWHATIWNGATQTNLNDSLSVSEVNAGWVLDGSTDINDNEWIVGNAHSTITGEFHPGRSRPQTRNLRAIYGRARIDGIHRSSP